MTYGGSAYASAPYAGASGGDGIVIAGGIATETDVAFAGIVAQVVYGGQAVETDTALAGAVITGTIIHGGTATETDEALTGTIIAGSVVQGGTAIELDEALAGNVNEPIIIEGGIAIEVDEAFAGIVALSYETSDTTNRVGGRVRGGTGVATWEPPVVTPPAFPLMVHDHEKAHAFSTPTISGPGRPTYTVTEISQPRHRDRILVGGKDITFFRDVPTPTPGFRLIEPLDYGAGTLRLPQVSLALGERPGLGALKWLRIGAPVVVQRVDPETNTVAATDYLGLITAFNVSGNSLTCSLGGHVSGRAAMMDEQPVLFRKVKDVGNWVYSAVMQSAPVNFTPRLGPVTGIKLASRGGTSKLDHISELLALSVHQGGAQWTVGHRRTGWNPDGGQVGTWGMWVKDATTIHATIYLDDARMVGDLHRDLSEEPNRIYVTGINHDGLRIKNGRYPGLTQGEAAPYPMFDSSPFGIGTTNGDTDTGDGITVMLAHMVTMGYLSPVDNEGVYDAAVARAVRRLQDDAGVTETGTMNLATWRKLYDLDATGYSLANSRIEPMSQDPRVKRYLLTASGAIADSNPVYDPHRPKVDRSVNVGVGFTRRQMRDFARDERREASTPNWIGTITCHLAAITGEHNPGDPAPTDADLMPARAIRPGMNVWLPLFQGGTLVHVSGVEVPEGGRDVVLTVDTRARDTMAAWECITRNRESRNNPARAWLNNNRTSGMNRDAHIEFDEIGGVLDDSVALTADTWNIVPVVAGQAGTIARIRLEMTNPCRFGVAVFARPISANRLNHLIGNPLTEAGTAKWQKPAVRRHLETRGLVEAWGTHEDACGYGYGSEPDESPVTGVFDDQGSWGFHTFAEPVLYVAVYPLEATRVAAGRILWPQLEPGA